MGAPQDRRSLILQEAAGLFARKGVSATTVREIADAVGMLSGSLYHHFSSKDEMVVEIVTNYLDDLTARYREITRSGSDSRTQLGELIRASLATIEAHPHATEIYQNSGNYLAALEGYQHITAARRTTQKIWTSVLDAGAAAGEIRSDIPPRVLYRMMRDALWLSVRWFKPTRQYSMKRFADDFVSLYLEGLLPRS